MQSVVVVDFGATQGPTGERLPVRGPRPPAHPRNTKRTGADRPAQRREEPCQEVSEREADARNAGRRTTNREPGGRGIAHVSLRQGTTGDTLTSSQPA